MKRDEREERKQRKRIPNREAVAQRKISMGQSAKIERETIRRETVRRSTGIA